MNERSKERTYSDEEVKERLRQELPHWYLEGGWIRRKVPHARLERNADGDQRGRSSRRRPPGTIPTSRPLMHGWRCACKTMLPKASPTRTSSWPRRSRTWSIGSREGSKSARRHAGHGPALRLYQIRHLSAALATLSTAGKRKWATPGSMADRCALHAATAEARDIACGQPRAGGGRAWAPISRAHAPPSRWPNGSAQRSIT